MIPRIAVVGANGFIGSRLVESLVLSKTASVRPVVRRVAALARSSRFHLDGAVADPRDRPGLARALQDCEYVVHTFTGDEATIVDTTHSFYDACQDAGVKRVVYFSTASVHGQAPEPGCNESSPLSGRQSIPYNNLKVKAEKRLLAARSKGSVELVILRPGIVFGPRSAWVGQFANELLAGKAYLVNGGNGVCNSIYVDNVVEAVRLALTAKGADGEAFLLGDRESVTWRDLYAPIARALGADLDRVPSLAPSTTASAVDRFLQFKERPLMQRCLNMMPNRLRYAGFMAVMSWLQFDPDPSPLRRPAEPVLVPDLERTLLHTCRWKFPFDKAARVLGYAPRVSFEEGIRRSIAWLKFAGYPVVAEDGTNINP